MVHLYRSFRFFSFFCGPEEPCCSTFETRMVEAFVAGLGAGAAEATVVTRGARDD